jgi:bifunctional ADP-heptose synthase (sugar kinase/adenylyltransferase)
MVAEHKILPLDELAVKVEKLKAAGKTVIQSHGVFDIIHPGIIQHLKDAKSMGDVLVVTVIKDKDVHRST